MALRQQINPCRKTWRDLLKTSSEEDPEHEQLQDVLEAVTLCHSKHARRIEALGRGLLARLARRARWFTALLSTYVELDVLDDSETTLEKAARIHLEFKGCAFLKWIGSECQCP